MYIYSCMFAQRAGGSDVKVRAIRGNTINMLIFGNDRERIMLFLLYHLTIKWRGKIGSCSGSLP